MNTADLKYLRPGHMVTPDRDLVMKDGSIAFKKGNQYPVSFVTKKGFDCDSEISEEHSITNHDNYGVWLQYFEKVKHEVP